MGIDMFGLGKKQPVVGSPLAPPPETLLDKIERLETAGMEKTKEWHTVWSEAYHYFFSLQDRAIKKKVDWDYIVLNYIWPTAMQEIAKLSKNLQRVIVLPFSDDDLEAAEVWRGACQWHLQNHKTLNMRVNHPAAIFCGKLRGYRVSRVYWEDKVEWDDQNKQWKGDIKYKLWRPELFWSDGEEDINDGNCGVVRWVTLEYAQSRWPTFADKFEEIAVTVGDSSDNEFGGVDFRSWISAGELKQTDIDEDSLKPKMFDGASKMLDIMEGIPKVRSGQKVVRISEAFLKDYEEVPMSESEAIQPQELLDSGVAIQDLMGKIVDTQTGLPFTPETYPTNTREWIQPLYPKGRWIISAGQGANRIILNPEEEEQRWRFSRWPFITSPHYLLPFMWQGMNAVSLYKSAQDMINVSMTHLVNNLKQFGDPHLSIEEDAIALDPRTKKPVNEGLISSAAGSIWRWAKGAISGSKFRIEPPVPPSPAAMAIAQIMMQEFKNLTGLQGVSRGEPMPSGTTATEAANAAVNSNDRIALQSVYEDEWFSGICHLACEMMQAYYDEGRWIRIVGDDKIAGVQQITQKVKTVKYDVTVELGATLPFDEEKRIARYKLGYDLFNNPAPNPMLPEMLRALQIPSWKKLLADYEPWQLYIGVKRLYEQVISGKMPPEQATQIILQEATKLFMSQGGGQIQQPVKGEVQNG